MNTEYTNNYRDKKWKIRKLIKNIKIDKNYYK